MPCPQVDSGQVLIQTQASLISAGTERMLVEFSKVNLISKAKKQPDKAKQVLDKAKTDQLTPTFKCLTNILEYENGSLLFDEDFALVEFSPK